MTEGPIWRHLVFFSIPLLIGNLFQQMYNTVDTLVIGNYLGAGALAAVSAGFAIIGLMLSLFTGLGTGSSVVIAQHFGAGDDDMVRRSVGTLAAFTLIAGVVMTVVWMLAAAPLLALIGTPEEIFDDAVIYLQIFFSAMLPALIFNMGSGVLRAVGDSRSPLVYLVISAVVNIALDLLFVASFGWGVAGVAAATAIAQVVSAIFVIAKLSRSRASYALNIRAIKLDGVIIAHMLRIGVPAGLQSMLMGISNVVVQGCINSFGTVAIAAWGITVKLDGTIILPSLSFSLATMTFSGQNFGARKFDRISGAVKTNLILSMSTTAILSLTICFFAREIVGFFTSDPDVIDFGVRVTYSIEPFYFIMSIMHTFSGVLQGAGYSFVTMTAYLLCLCVFRLIYLSVAGGYLPDVVLISSMYIVSWVLCSSSLAIYYKTAFQKRCKMIG